VVMRSTKQTDRRAAHRIADEWEEAARKARAGELTQAAILKTMGGLLEGSLGERLQVQTTRQFLTEWLGKSGRSEGTMSRYRPVVTGFLAAIGERRAGANVGSITTLEIERFRDAQIAEGKTASTANLAVKILRAAFAAARRLGLSLTNPAEGVSLLEQSDTEERIPFTEAQIVELMSVADDEWRGMILLGYHSGLRLSDAAQLTWENIDLAARTLIFRDAKTSRRKKGRKKDTTVSLHPDLVEYLDGLHAGDDPRAPLFPSLHGRKPGSSGGLSNAFNRLMAKAGVRAPMGEEKKGKGRQFKQLGFHALRHTMISNFANADIPADVRKEIAGHSSDEIHRRYVHLDLSAQRRALERIGSILPKCPQHRQTPLTSLDAS
ncbi:MAG: site-specific integrase, partial [Chthoniobacteraceae bacterium]